VEKQAWLTATPFLRALFQCKDMIASANFTGGL
jgi:hypothetical protein